MRTMLLLTIISVSDTLTHFKSPTCWVYVQLVSDDDSTDSDSGSDTEEVETLV
jgi:hypothetical protein